MENQHRHIKGYRELSQAEIDLMNRIKEKGAELVLLAQEVRDVTSRQAADKFNAATKSPAASDERAEYQRFNDSEAIKWADLGKTDIQTGVMALVRAVAQPTSC